MMSDRIERAKRGSPLLGVIGADHLAWLRKLAAGKPAAQMGPEDWRARAALVLPYLESREPLAAERAASTLAAAATTCRYAPPTASTVRSRASSNENSSERTIC